MTEELCYGCMKFHPAGQECECGFDRAHYTEDPHRLKLGTMLKGRYETGKCLGEGGFGITYVGRDTVLEMKVCIKEFYMSAFVSRNTEVSAEVNISDGENGALFQKNKEKFLDEARVCAKFANEDGIVGVRDFFEENNTAYIVMDFLEGESLQDYLKRRKRVSWQRTLELMDPVLKALNLIHQQGIIHRDISPDNIMMLKDGKIQLIDFGAARDISSKDIKSLSLILKPGYAPAEQYRSKGQQGPWTDVYALCATMYVLITGVVPEDAMERMFADKVIPPHEMIPDCCVAVSNVIMKGMAIKADDRYRSVEELRSYLQLAKEHPDDNTLGLAGKKHPAAAEEPTVSESKPGNNATVFAVDEEALADTVKNEPQENRTVFAVDESGEEEEKEPEIKPEIKPEAEPEKKEEEPAVAAAEPEPAPAQETKPAESETVKKPQAKKKGSQDTIVLAVILAAVVLMIGSLVYRAHKYAVEHPAAATAQNKITASEAFTDDDLAKIAYTLALQMNNSEVSLPATYEEFKQAGWSLLNDEELNEYLSANATSDYVSLVNDDQNALLKAEFWNPTNDTVQLKDAYIRLISYTTDTEDGDVSTENQEEMPAVSIGGVELAAGEVTEDEFQSLFKDVAEKTEAHTYVIENEGTGCRLSFSNGVLSGLEVYTAITSDQKVLPEGADISYQTTPEISDGTKALFGANSKIVWDASEAVLSNENTVYLRDYVSSGMQAVIMHDGSESTVESGLRIRDYEKEGFTVEDKPEYLSAGEIRTVTLVTPDGLELQAEMLNPYMKALAADYCMIDEIMIYETDLQAGDTVTLIAPDTGNQYVVMQDFVLADAVNEMVSEGIQVTDQNVILGNDHNAAEEYPSTISLVGTESITGIILDSYNALIGYLYR